MMMESATGSASDLVRLTALQHRLWELLNNKRYLLVLDDIWNEDQEKWFELKKVVACGSIGSSIIVTTRLKKVADIVRTLPSHYLTGLLKKHCWMLLKERAFGHEKQRFTNLEAIGEQIANKCGVPLAAKELGGLLRFKRTAKEWNYVKESEIWELPHEETLILPALRSVPISGKTEVRVPPNVKGLIKKHVMMRSAEAFPNLEEVDIMGDCFLLTLPPLSTSLKKLKKLNCSSILLASLSKVDLHTLTGLMVDFWGSSVLTRITVDTLQSLTNLKILAICRARGRGDDLSLPEKGLRYPTAPEELMISNCVELVELLDGIKHLLRLKAVYMRGLPKMVSVPKALKHLSSSLQRLSLRVLPQLSSLPDWLGELTSLIELYIWDCPKIASFPASIRGMTNLRYLYVRDCPELEMRCERANGEEWHKISHIPRLQIGE